MIVYRVQHAVGRDEPLARLLAGMPPETQVITDRAASKDLNPWRCYRRCLSGLPADATHVVVVQDDAVVCQNFSAAVERLVESRPTEIISLFVGGLRNATSQAFMEALAAGRRWAPLAWGSTVHVVALCWPVALAGEFLAWTETAKIPSHRGIPRSDDAAAGAWVTATRRPIWATVPCLTEHPDIESVVHPKRAKAGLDKGRVAISFIGDRDPLELDWSV